MTDKTKTKDEEKKDDIDIVIDGAEKKEDAVIKADSEDEGEDTEKVIDDLKAKLDKTTNERNSAESRARQHERVASESQSQVAATNLALINTGIGAVKQEAASLMNDYAVAMEDADYKLAAEIQYKMSINANELSQLEAGKNALEANGGAAPKREQQTQTDDPVESLAKRMGPNSGAWIRSHPEYAVGDNNARLVRAHNRVANQEHAPAVDSQEYIEAVEKELGLRKEAKREDEDARSEAATGRRRESDEAPPSAPVSRTGRDTNGQEKRPRVVKLTQEQKEFCDTNGIKYEKYAKNMLDLQAEGRINKPN